MGWQGQAGCVARVDKLYPESEIHLVSRLLGHQEISNLLDVSFTLLFLLVQ